MEGLGPGERVDKSFFGNLGLIKSDAMYIMKAFDE